jgi:lactoylglutathione lyase
MQLTQVRLIVADFVACFRFYRDVLGLVPQVNDERGPYGKFSLPEGDAAIALHDRADLEASLGPLASALGDRALVVLKVVDVQAAVSGLRSRGANIVRDPQDAWGRLRVAYLRDPEGNLLELQQWLEATKQPT